MQHNITKAKVNEVCRDLSNREGVVFPVDKGQNCRLGTKQFDWLVFKGTIRNLRTKLAEHPKFENYANKVLLQSILY